MAADPHLLDNDIKRLLSDAALKFSTETTDLYITLQTQLQFIKQEYETALQRVQQELFAMLEEAKAVSSRFARDMVQVLSQELKGKAVIYSITSIRAALKAAIHLAPAFISLINDPIDVRIQKLRYKIIPPASVRFELSEEFPSTPRQLRSNNELAVVDWLCSNCQAYNTHLAQSCKICGFRPQDDTHKDKGRWSVI